MKMGHESIGKKEKKSRGSSGTSKTSSDSGMKDTSILREVKKAIYLKPEI